MLQLACQQLIVGYNFSLNRADTRALPGVNEALGSGVKQRASNI